MKLLPAPGSRHRNSGTLYDAGQYGWSWSLSVLAGSSFAHHLYFSNGELIPLYSSGRANARQVRCLLE